MPYHPHSNSLNHVINIIYRVTGKNEEAYSEIKNLCLKITDLCLYVSVCTQVHTVIVHTCVGAYVPMCVHSEARARG